MTMPYHISEIVSDCRWLKSSYGIRTIDSLCRRFQVFTYKFPKRSTLESQTGLSVGNPRLFRMFPFTKCWWPFQIGVYGKWFEKSDCLELKNDVAMLFVRCSHVETFEICHRAFELFNDIKGTLRGVSISELKIKDVRRFDTRLTWALITSLKPRNSHFRQNLRELVNVHSVKRLWLSCKSISPTEWQAVKPGSMMSIFIYSTRPDNHFPDITNFLKIFATPKTTVTLYIRFTFEESRANTTMVRHHWEERVNDLNGDGNLSLKLNLDYFGVTINVTPKMASNAP